MKRSYLVFLLSAFFSLNINGQSPGLIVRPQGGAGVTPLNPNGDGYSSASTAGYITNDITEGELVYKVVPVAITEPTGDLSTGPSGGFSDIVTRVDGSGFYLLTDATNIFFRLRIGGIVSGSKGYSVLIDTDKKIGGSGPHADPNYVAASGNSPGNPGFEYEVVFQSNFQVAVYNIDGTANPGTPVSFSLTTNSQISVALSTDGNNPDYFYDWFVPLTAIGSPTSIRTAVTTVTSPNSALQATRSDIYGINDAQNANVPGAWEDVIEAQPEIDIITGVVSPTCTAAPVLSGPIAAGTSVTVSGTWTRMDGTKPSTATITLYRNGIEIGTTSVNTGNTWNIVAPTVANGDVFYARAQATGESICLQSNNITSLACITLPSSPVLTCGSLKGISGTMPTTASGNTVEVYLVPTTSASPTSNLVSSGANLTYPTTTSFAFFTNGCSGGANNVATGLYLILTRNGSCVSAPSYICINSGSSGAPPPLSSNALSLTTPIYPTNTVINGSGAASGDFLRLYINGRYITTITATGTNFSFTGLTLLEGDQIQIFSQTGTACMTQSAIFTVSCFAPAPSITTNASGNLLVGATVIDGTSASPGATVQVYRGTFPSGVAVGSAATVSGSGLWSVTVPALVGAESYYAIQTVNGCASTASLAATVLAPSACPTISGSYTESSTSVSGTMPTAFTGTIRLYLDGALIGSQTISASTTWIVTVASNTLYYNAAITATAQASGSTESIGCSFLTVGCTSPPTPVVTPTSITILIGNTVNFAVSNVQSGNWYALLDNSGNSYSTSSYRNTSTSFGMTTSVFNALGTYNLKLTADALTGCPASFANATVTVVSSLPLNLIRFTGEPTNAGVKLVWETSNEINLSHFEIEESSDGRTFNIVSRIEPHASTNLIKVYETEVRNRIAGSAFYRLKMVDTDGKYQYSQILNLKQRLQTRKISVGPNPFNDRITLSFQAEKTGKIIIVINDVLGRQVLKLSRMAQEGTNIITIDNLSNLQKGIYFMAITNEQRMKLYEGKLSK